MIGNQRTDSVVEEQVEWLDSGHSVAVHLAGVKRSASEGARRAAVCDAARAATDFGWLSRGDAVFVKTASNSGDVYPATTSPLAVGAMIGLLKEQGAGRVIVGDMSGIRSVKQSPSGTKGSTRRLMQSSGLAQAVEAAGGELVCFEEPGWEAFYEENPVVSAYWQGSLTMPMVLQEVEHIVLMPRCGRHMLAGASLGMKAAVGYWRTDTRLEYHRDAESFQEKTAEGNAVPTLLQKQRLVLTMADRVMITLGPDFGRIVEPEIGLAIASESVVAHDMVSLAWLLENRGIVSPRGLDALGDNSGLFARFSNRMVVGMLGGPGPVLTAEPLIKNRLDTIWDDRVLNRAYEVLGGRPMVSLELANDQVPRALEGQLGEMVRPQA